MMLLKQTPSWTIADREATPEALYLSRRSWLAGAMAAGMLPGAASAQIKLKGAPSPYSTTEPKTPFEDVTGYNNFYELGLDKDDPARNAHLLQTKPWSVKVDGLVKEPKTYDLAALLRGISLEDRVYRMRCVEAWSMVIPWVGFPLASLIKRLEPLGSAKYIAFETLGDAKQLPGLRADVLDWPYKEGLRLDEAMHPLTILAVGLYGQTLPGQNGAPLRLVVPWKYGFKGIKSIVRISFTDKAPATAWNVSAPGEYGFFANVNPAVDHPRWSQAKERRIGELLRRPTLPFNGYGAEVAGLYKSMNLRKFY